jgi:hypothetical protein
MFRFEWIIVELLVLGLLVFELARTRRAIRRDKAAAVDKPRQPEG